MAYEMKDHTFTLFDNDKKGNDKAPDYKGKGLVNGQEIRIAVWKKTSQSGIEYLSGTIEEQNKPDLPEEPKKKQEGLLDDSIPF